MKLPHTFPKAAFALLAIGLLSLPLSGCGLFSWNETDKSSQPTATANEATRDNGLDIAGNDEIRDSTRFTVDSTASQIRVFVFREGRLARYGHNHVIAISDIRGTLALTKEGQFGGSLTLPVGRFDVDAAELRAARRDLFDTTPKQRDIDGTRNNMLGEKFLDADQFPQIRLAFPRQPLPKSPTASVTLDIQTKSNTTRIQLPVSIQQNKQRISVSGILALKQTELGLKPFSVMFGALRVRDEMQIEFDLSLVADAPNSASN